ncbi:hypothetical protein EO95_17085 [Methanosarcina sp. 1.H.T.1A.1]|uniref:DUF1616 domain-containing protein n=1 Tax=Methanosarcina sp. 1.H.T.1A.1 TaxID=1483602 RepID=UPI00062170BC|nr:DUF1616 domain-containing protein [Methanosarcina sp. 1.H.T.1A.1]KKH99284.1 hypothetical protein EO95_17085 [Methanosarcina sp. 1.H.T.1A.1]
MAGTRKFSSDLLLVAALVILTDIFVLIPPLNGIFLRTALGLPMVLFLPGYALIAALFPAKKDLDGIERTALSFGLSIAIVPLIGLGLNYTPWGIRLIPILMSLSGFILIMCGAAYFRRRQLPEEEAFAAHIKASFLALKTEVIETPETKIDKILTVILIFSILASVATLIYVILTPKEGEHFTEFYILGPEGMADNYPTRYAPGENGTVIVGIANHEYRTMNYSMEMRLENTSLDLPENLRHISLGHNATWEEPVTIIPPFEGKGMKLEFLLFNETDKNTPYRDLHLWINVTEVT